MKLAAVAFLLLIALCFLDVEGARKWKCYLKRSRRYPRRYWVVVDGEKRNLMKCPKGTFFSKRECNCISPKQECDKRFAGGRKFVQLTGGGAEVFYCPKGTVFDEGNCNCIYS